MIAKTAARHTGDEAEATALKYLQDRGLSLQQRNFECRYGEIDLIMRDDTTLVFVEVRYRRSAHFGGALCSVTAQKQEKIRKTILHYISEKKLGERYPLRCDVVAIEAETVHWIKGAF